LDTPAVQERGGPDDNGIGPVATHCLEAASISALVSAL
jgi:hypothetical protein